MQTDTVYRQELTFINTLYFVYVGTDTMFQQVIGIYLHACRLTTDIYKLRDLTIYSSRKPHPLCKG